MDVYVRSKKRKIKEYHFIKIKFANKSNNLQNLSKN